MLRWKYWEPCEECPEPRSFVMERDGRIIAHVGLWSVKVWTAAKRERGVHARLGRGPSGAQCGRVLVYGPDQELRLRLWNGWLGNDAVHSAEVGLPYCCRSPDLGTPAPSVAANAQVPEQGSAPAAALRAEYLVVEDTSKTGPRGWAAVEPEPGSARGLTVLASERDEFFFRYLQQCPVARCLTFHIANEGRIVGFFGPSVVGEQARVEGVWLENPSSDIWRIAFHLAQDAALKHTNTSELIARCTTGPSAIAAEPTGMRLREPLRANIAETSLVLLINEQ
jgi:hypothetical protein